MLSTDHIVMGGKRMRLVEMQQDADTPAGKETFSTVPIDAEGNDVMDEEASADSRPRKRKKVRCFDNLVTVEKGAARSRGSEGGWEYTWEAKRNQFLHEASGGHAACTRESQRSRLDAERRMIAAAITVEDGKHLPRIDKETPLHLRPSYRTMVERVNPGFNILQSLCVALKALTPTVFTRDSDGRMVRLLTNGISFDGTQLQAHHLMAGVLITFLQYIKGRDAFGTPVMVVEAYRSNMMPGLCANKIGNTVRNDKTGEVYLQETARALALSAEISGLTAVFGNGDTYFSFDGAAENSGGNLDNMFGVKAVLYHLYATREPWERTRKMLDDCGVGAFLRQCLAQKDLRGLIAEVKRILRQEKNARSQARAAKREAKMAQSASSDRAADLNTALNTDSARPGRPDSGSLDPSEKESDPGQGQPRLSEDSEPLSPPTPLPIPSHALEEEGDLGEVRADNDSDGESEKSEDSELSSDSERSESDDSDDDNEDGDEAPAPAQLPQPDTVEPVHEEFLQDCPKSRDAPRMLKNTSAVVHAHPECGCRRWRSGRACHDNDECKARYMLGTVYNAPYKRGEKNLRHEFDFAHHPEKFRDHDCYGILSTVAPNHDADFDNDDDGPSQKGDPVLERTRSTVLRTRAAIVVKSRCKESVLNLSRMRHTWLVWSVLCGQKLRDLGLWRPKTVPAEAQPVSQAALDAHAAALSALDEWWQPSADQAAAPLDANRDRRALMMLRIPTPEDFEDSLSVLNAALDQSVLPKPTKDSTDAIKYEYRKRHALRFEARLFLFRLGSILYNGENRRRRLPSFIGNKRYCMGVNPLSFLPCMDSKPGPDDAPDGKFCQVNGGVQCGMHRAHNSTKRYTAILNAGFEQTIIHAGKWVMVPYYRAPLQTAVNLLLCDEGSDDAKKRDEETSYYMLVIKAIEEQHKKREGLSLTDIRKAMHFDSAQGFGGVRTVCDVRWGSVLHSAGEHLPLAWALALAIIRRFTLGTDSAKAKASLAIVSFRGFIPSEHPEIKVELHAQRVLAYLTRTQDLLQLASMRLVYKLTIRLFLIHGSSDHECGTHTMMGLNSVVRNVLLVLSVDIWVAVRGARLASHGSPNGRWAAKGRGWGRKLANPFRTDGAEFESGSSLLFLDPACGPKVAKRLGFACDEEAEHAVSELVATLRLLAMREGEVMPEDMLQAYRIAHPTLFQMRLSNRTYAVKMSEMQFFIKHVVLDVLKAVREQMQRELFGLHGALAGMTETERSSEFVYEAGAGGTPGPQYIVSATAMALAHAAAFSIGAKDLLHFIDPQMDALKGDKPEHFLPSWGRAVSAECRNQLDDFLGIPRWNAQDPSQPWTQQCPQIGPCGRHDVGTLPQIKGCAPGKNRVDGKELFDRPLQCFPELHEYASKAQYVIGNSKPCEGSLSTPAALIKTKARLTFVQIVHLMRRRFFLDVKNEKFLQRAGANNAIMFEAASAVGQLAGWRDTIFSKDQILDDTMHANYTMQDPKKFPAGIRKGGAWKKTNFCEESRTDKFSKPKKGSEEDRRLNALIMKICERAGPAGPNNRVVADTELQLRARAVRAKRGNRKSGVTPAVGTAALHRSLSRSGRASAGGGPGSSGQGARRGRSAPASGRGRGVSRSRGGRRPGQGRKAGPSILGGEDNDHGIRVDDASSGVQGCPASGEAGGGTHSCGRRRYRSGRQQGFDSEDDSNDESWAPPPGIEGSEEAAAAAPPEDEEVRCTRARAAAASAAPGTVPISAGDAGSASASPTAMVSLGAESAAEHPDTLGDVSRALRPPSAVESAAAAAPGNGSAGQADCLVQGSAVDSAPPPSDPRLVPASRTVRGSGGYDNMESDEALVSGKADDDDDDNVPLIHWQRDNVPLIQRTKRPEPAAKAASDSSRESESHGSETDDDDIPLNERASKRGRPSDSCGGSESDGSESNESAVLPDTIAQGETWSVDFCHDIHNVLYSGEDGEGPWQLSRVKWGDNLISVTRVPQKNATEFINEMGLDLDLKISFDVILPNDDEDDACHGYYYIMYDSFAGAMLVEPTFILKVAPKGRQRQQYANSIRYRRVYRSKEALNRTDSTQDSKKYLGKDSLQKFAEQEVEGDPDSVTYHVGDCEYTGDVKLIIGVVRWFSESYRRTRGAAAIKAGRAIWQYPKADLVFTGAPFSEQATSRRRKT